MLRLIAETRAHGEITDILDLDARTAFRLWRSLCRAHRRHSAWSPVMASRLGIAGRATVFSLWQVDASGPVACVASFDGLQDDRLQHVLWYARNN